MCETKKTKITPTSGVFVRQRCLQRFTCMSRAEQGSWQTAESTNVDSSAIFPPGTMQQGANKHVSTIGTHSSSSSSSSTSICMVAQRCTLEAMRVSVPCSVGQVYKDIREPAVSSRAAAKFTRRGSFCIARDLPNVLSGCLCVCVCVSERDRQSQRQTDRPTDGGWKVTLIFSTYLLDDSQFFTLTTMTQLKIPRFCPFFHYCHFCLQQ